MAFILNLPAFVLIICALRTAACAVMILPKGDTLYPMGSTHPFEMQCWVQEGAKPVWTLGTDPLQTHDLVPTAAEKYENRSLIFINTTGNYSYISITDEGFEMFTSVNGSAKLHIGCIPHQSCFACPSNETAILKIIVLFATPGVPEDLKVSTDFGFLTWTRPENMLPEIPLTYKVLVKDLETGEEVAAYENMTEQSLSIKVPRYYNVSVTASCVFCKVGQTAIAFLEPGTSHILSARIEYVEDCSAVCIICTFEKSSPATACHVTDGIHPFIIQKGQDMCVQRAKINESALTAHAYVDDEEVGRPVAVTGGEKDCIRSGTSAALSGAVSIFAPLLALTLVTG